MSSQPELTRRRTLKASGVLTAALLAGCTDSDTNGDDAEGGGSDSNGGDESATGSNTDGENPTGDLDLRQANVVEVAAEQEGNAYRFDVALHHDDDGEDGYADWWQVERLDGSRLGRRELLHPHSEQPFTRSETIEIPDSVTCVVVRGHDQTHGYGGRATLVVVDSGDSRAVDQGAEKQSFGPGDCP